MNTTYAVIDFETTGLSPAYGARPTEVAAVMVSKGKIVDRYQCLMNAGVKIPFFIEEMTGISNAMLSAAPDVKTVMGEVSEFVGNHTLVAHNASFDQRFWDAELKRLRKRRQQQFLCSKLLARRVYLDFNSYSLAHLADKLELPSAGRAHRALADAQVTAHLLIDIQKRLKQQYKLKHIAVDLMLEIQSVPKGKVRQLVEQYR